MDIELEGICYVVVQTDKVHPITPSRHDLKWYPETAMTFLESVQYVPYIKSIVTENPWLISCYRQKNVRVWEKKKWTVPTINTFGASVNMITMNILGVDQTIPSMVLGGNEIKKFITKINKEI